LSSAGLWALVLLAVAVPAFGQDRHERTRIDLYRPNGSRSGYVIVDHQTGRVDTFDEKSRRTGWGRIERDGRIDLYRNDSTRAGSARQRREPK
jgi:hypothetical protein